MNHPSGVSIVQRRVHPLKWVTYLDITNKLSYEYHTFTKNGGKRKAQDQLMWGPR